VLVLGVALAALGALAGTGSAARQDEDAPLIQTPSYATADSNDRMIAVTGIDVTGTSVLYVIDTIERRLSVYQADGGGRSTAGIRWIGARNIDLDFAVDGWNDRSDVKYKELRERLDSIDLLPGK
jgi:hypothetical protein